MPLVTTRALDFYPDLYTDENRNQQTAGESQKLPAGVQVRCLMVDKDRRSLIQAGYPGNVRFAWVDAEGTGNGQWTHL